MIKLRNCCTSRVWPENLYVRLSITHNLYPDRFRQCFLTAIWKGSSWVGEMDGWSCQILLDCSATNVPRFTYSAQVNEGACQASGIQSNVTLSDCNSAINLGSTIGTATPACLGLPPDKIPTLGMEFSDTNFWTSEPPRGCCSEQSKFPMSYSKGTVLESATDIPAPGFGGAGGHTRAFSSKPSVNQNLGNGWNWSVHQWPYVVVHPNGNVGVVIDANNSSSFSFVGGGYTNNDVCRFETLGSLPSNGGYVYGMTDGSTLTFDNTTHVFRSQTDPAGNKTQVTALASNGINIAAVQRSVVAAGVTTTDELSYDYTTVNSMPLLQTVTLRRRVGSGSWINVNRASYIYYDGSDANGAPGDLQTVATDIWSGTAWQTTGTTYYRYYLELPGGSSSSSSAGGSFATGPVYSHLLKYAVGPAAYNRLLSDGYDPRTASDSTLLMYADTFYEYDAQCRVSGGKIKSGSQQYQFSYSGSGNSDDLNHWKTKTTETLPDGNQNVIYSNYLGQTMLKVFKSGVNEWLEFWKYGSTGGATLHANPSAVSGYDESKADLLNFNSGTGKYQYLRDHDGLIETNTFHAPTGYVTSSSVQQGQLGTPILVSSSAYCQCGSACTCGGSSSSSSNSAAQTGNVWFLATSTQYPSDIDPSKTIVTSHCYSFYGSTCAVQQHVTTLPVISTTQNGSGVANTNRKYFDSYGNLTWKMDERGFITRMAYDIPTGAMTQLVQDVDTSLYTDVPSGWTTPSGGGLNIVNDMTIDSQGRTTQSLGPSHTIDLNGTATVIRTASWTVYDDVNHITYSGQGYATGTSPSYTYTLVNPVSITKMDANGRVNEQIQAAAASTSGSLASIITAAGGGAAAFPQSSYTRWTTNQYTDCCLAASQRVYKLIPASGTGTSGTNYDETDYGYNIMKRRNRTVSPGGTITDIVYEPRGLVIGTYIGTNDAGATENDPTGGGSDPSNNMVIVTGNQYDDGLDGGDGNLTQVTQYVDSSNTRVTAMTYDFRNRNVTTDGEIDYFQKLYYDNLSRIVKTERYDTTAAGNLIARSETKFDDLGRIYQSIQYGVDPSTGTVGYGLTDNTWYDAAGNVIKSFPSGSSLFTKTTIDSLGRTTIRYSGYDLSETSYADALTVTNDVILEQAETVYDSASKVIQMISRQRYHNAVDTQKGALQNPSTTPKARVTYAASWQDGVGRTFASANYGTNGGTALPRPSTVPVASDSVLVTRRTFDSAGNTRSTTDPAGMVMQWGYDAVGRKTLQFDNYETSSSSSSSAGGGGCAPSDDVNRTTEYTYTPDGQQATLTAVNARTGDQTTTWTYGTTLSNSDIASSQLLLSVTYPDSTGGSDLVSYAYNRQGQRRGMTDQRGCVHVYEFDKLSRQTHDRVTTAGLGVDTAVLRLSTSYEVRGMATKLTSWNNASASSGSVVNECQFVYNNFAQLITDYQEHSGAVNTSTSPKVQYGYANGSGNTIRPTTLTYPNGRVLTYGYGTTNGVDDAISRVSNLIDNDGTTHLADYSFVGMGNSVVVDYTQPEIKYTLVDLSGTNDPDTGDIYSGWDRFGRVKDCRWYDYGHSADAARLKYGYDRASDCLWRADLVAQSLGKNFDERYSYDGLHRLKDMQRGLLATGDTAITNENFAQCWTLDSTSNWAGFQESSTGGPETLVQSRTANLANEITGIANSVGAVWVTPAYDAAGNTTSIPQPADPTKSFTATYDPWNRLVQLVDTTSSNTVQQNTYDARTFRTKQQTYTSGTLSETRHFYFTSKWQSIEVRHGTTPNFVNPERQQVWGGRYVDDLVLRDRDFDGDGSLDERLYGIQDANWNLIALSDTSATVQERYLYSLFGSPSYLNGNMSALLPHSEIGSELLFTGQHIDAGLQLYLFRSRYYHASIGGFATRDQIGYRDGLNLLAAYFVPHATDPYGLFVPTYTVDDVVWCYSRLSNVVATAWLFYPCAAALLSIFLGGRGTDSPECPSPCLDALKANSNPFGAQAIQAVSQVARCDSGGVDVVTSTKSMASENGDLFYALHSFTSNTTSKCSWGCGPCRCPGTNCKCNANCITTVRVTDTYDFCSSMPATQPVRSLFWCGCIIENIFKRSSDQKDPHEFGVKCTFTGSNAGKFEKQC